MISKKWTATAPSNIALIKYMGKIDHTSNVPTNTSISLTLSHLISVVELECIPGSTDQWSPLTSFDGPTFDGRELDPLTLSERGQKRFLAHLGRIKAMFQYEGGFHVRSGNGFPSDCGLASSASSFAALTRGALQALNDLGAAPSLDVHAAAELSRQGSGSSCRSFFAPWSIWDAGGARAAELPYAAKDLIHQVIVVESRIKEVSSSEAHKRVTSSLLFQGRPERAEKRVDALISALRAKNWSEAFEISWAEFWDMHALFETSRPSFGYMAAGSLEVLTWVRESTWKKNGDGPLVTMDAGANIHLIYRANDEGRRASEAARAQFQSRFRVVTDGAD